MKSLYIDQTMIYKGTELRSHWIYENFGLLGNAVVAFSGEANVTLDHMVDVEDVLKKEAIYSKNMLHFICEIFNYDLNATIAIQRLMICIIKDLIEELTDAKIKRYGDDLYEERSKLTVSIATASPVSTLIHTGINISSDGTPIQTKGLDDYGIKVSDFAEKVMHEFTKEFSQIKKARCKVKGVF